MQSHYNYVFDNITSTYNFTTRNDILYRVAFVVDETFSTIAGEEIPNIYQLVVEKANEETEPFDAKVSRTIEDIVERFFHNVQNALIYICSDDDEKAVVKGLSGCSCLAQCQQPNGLRDGWRVIGRVIEKLDLEI